MSYCWACDTHHKDIADHAECSQRRTEQLRERVNNHQVQNRPPLTGAAPYSDLQRRADVEATSRRNVGDGEGAALLTELSQAVGELTTRLRKVRTALDET